MKQYLKPKMDIIQVPDDVICESGPSIFGEQADDSMSWHW